MNVLETMRDLFIFGTAVIAIYGIDSWRRGSSAKKQIELAEETLGLFYEAEDVIRVIRYPGSYGGESSTRKYSESDDLKQKEARDKAYVLIRRYLKYKEIFNTIHSMRYRFMVMFGKQSAEPFDELHKLVKGILLSARRLAEIWAIDSSNIPQVDLEKHEYRQDQYEAIIWEESEDDEVNAKLKAIIKRIEDTCRFIIISRGTAYSFIKYKLDKLSELIKKKRGPRRSKIFDKVTEHLPDNRSSHVTSQRDF